MINYTDLIFERSKEGRRGYMLPSLDVPEKDINEMIPEAYLADEKPDLPEVHELDVVRHFTLLSQKNYGIDLGFYPLGSCTMKYNPKVNEWATRLPGFANIHPYQPIETVEGALELMYRLDHALSEISGMAKMTFQPAAGAHGELTGIMMIRKYHESRGDEKRNKIIVPDSAHGTNPATAAMAGYKIVEVKSDERGLVCVDALKEVLSDEIAGLMLTNPNTLGLFEKDIQEITDLVHEAGGLLYYDGANANAILGHARPGDMGFDIVHFNLHKTFSTPHGGGGPGAGPVGVVEELVEYLPSPILEKGDDGFFWREPEHTIGRMKDFHGHFGILVRAYAYISAMGSDGLKDAATKAVLNANYVAYKLKDRYNLAVDDICKHEFVLGGLKDDDNGIKTFDVAKRLMDFGFHPPTVYFPLIIPEAMMIEPTETESKDVLDQFIDAMLKIADEAENNPDIVREAPHNTIVRRPDEAQAARHPVLVWQREEDE